MKDPCTCNKELVQEVKDFIKHVKDVKEESITDYLMWKWKEFDPRFKCIVTKTHTRQEEHDTTGADFDLELWILENNRTVSFAVQAKKFLEKHNCYASSIRYPNNSSQQIDKLLSYSKSENKIPVYFLYSVPFESKTRCRNHYKDSGVFLVSAHDMKKFSQLKPREELSLDTILDKSHSLSCYFCHDKSGENGLFRYLGLNEDSDNDIAIPDYVSNILNGILNTNLPKIFRWVAVYDLRSNDSTEN